MAKKPENQERISSMDPEQFSKIMKTWGKWLASPRLHLSNLTDEEIRNIAKPAIVAHGFDAGHPKPVARELYELLPNAEWVEYSDRYTSGEIQNIIDMHAENDVEWSKELHSVFRFTRIFSTESSLDNCRWPVKIAHRNTLRTIC